MVWNTDINPVSYTHLDVYKRQTFNSIYGLAVKEKADKTANGMLKLSDMLRYVLTDTQSDFVRLNKEINYINNYIELQKLRIESDTIIQYQITGNQNLHVIAPMLLIPFIENAFKYGINPGKESNIDIQIKIEDVLLLLQFFLLYTSRCV